MRNLKGGDQYKDGYLDGYEVHTTGSADQTCVSLHRVGREEEGKEIRVVLRRLAHTEEGKREPGTPYSEVWTTA